MNRKETVLYCRSIAKLYGANLIVRKLKHHGDYDRSTKTIRVSNDLWLAGFKSVFFHELMHHIATDQGHYSDYHRYDFSRLERKYGVEEALSLSTRAEMWVDRKAMLLLLDFFPDSCYISNYVTYSETKRLLRKYYLGE
jgi:hypothetical protein